MKEFDLIHRILESMNNVSKNLRALEKDFGKEAKKINFKKDLGKEDYGYE